MASRAEKRHRYRTQARNGGRNTATRKRWRRNAWTRDQGICQLCGGPVPLAEATLDRVDPSRRYSLDNVWTAHSECNNRKGGQVLPRFAFRSTS